MKLNLKFGFSGISRRLPMPKENAADRCLRTGYGDLNDLIVSIKMAPEGCQCIKVWSAGCDVAWPSNPNDPLVITTDIADLTQYGYVGNSGVTGISACDPTKDYFTVFDAANYTGNFILKHQRKFLGNSQKVRMPKPDECLPLEAFRYDTWNDLIRSVKLPKGACIKVWGTGCNNANPNPNDPFVITSDTPDLTLYGYIGLNGVSGISGCSVCDTFTIYDQANYAGI